MKSLTASLLALTFVSVFSNTSQASVLNLTAASQADPVSGYEIDSSAVETVTGANKKLSLVGFGVRREAVPIFGVKNIYLAQYLAENATAVARDPKTTASSLTAAGVKAMRLTFIFSPIPINKIRTAFSNSLNLNLSDAEQTTYADDVNAFLDTVASAGFYKGTSITILGYTKADGSEDVVYEDTQGNVTSIASLKPIVPGFVNKVFSIWFGNIDPNDSGLINLENSLLTAPTGFTPAGN